MAVYQRTPTKRWMLFLHQMKQATTNDKLRWLATFFTLKRVLFSFLEIYAQIFQYHWHVLIFPNNCRFIVACSKSVYRISYFTPRPRLAMATLVIWYAKSCTITKSDLFSFLINGTATWQTNRKTLFLTKIRADTQLCVQVCACAEFVTTLSIANKSTVVPVGLLMRSTEAKWSLRVELTVVADRSTCSTYVVHERLRCNWICLERSDFVCDIFWKVLALRCESKLQADKFHKKE